MPNLYNFPPKDQAVLFRSHGCTWPPLLERMEKYHEKTKERMELASALATLYSSQKLALDPGADMDKKRSRHSPVRPVINKKLVSNSEKAISMYW